MKHLLITLVLLSGPALGASFDCTKATAPREKLICSDEYLSDKDEEMAQLYQGALLKLSDAGKQSLLSDQRTWLRFTTKACPDTDKNRQRVLHCLGAAYYDRIEDLEQTGRQIGPFLFTRSAHYSVHLPERLDPSDEDGHGGNGITTRMSAFPQIDSPVNPVAQAWNAKNRRDNDPGSYCEEGGASDDYSGGKVTFANAHLITVEWTKNSYCHGAAHGMGDVKAETLVLEPTPHKLTSADVFRDDRPWKENLTALIKDAVRQTYIAERKSEPHNLSQSAIANAAATPSRWLISDAGLGVAFNTYELGQGYAFAPTVTIPWTALKDILVANAPVF